MPTWKVKQEVKYLVKQNYRELTVKVFVWKYILINDVKEAFSNLSDF